MQSRRWLDSASIHSPSDPPEGSDHLAAVQHYIRFYRDDYDRVRTANKRRAKAVVVGAALGNASITVVGALTSLFGTPWLGVVSAAIGGLGLTIAAYEGLIRNRELWIRRTPTVHQLVELDRQCALLAISASNADRQDLAELASERLDRILTDALENWTDFRKGDPGRGDDLQNEDSPPQED